MGVAIVHSAEQIPADGPQERYNFLYGDEIIEFERVSKNGKSPRITIKVHPDCRVVVHAPLQASNDDVLHAVKKRSRWIYQHLKQFRAQLEHITPRSFVSGESHYYLGRQYLLKVHCDPATKQQVKLLRGRLDVTVRDKGSDRIRTLLREWYKGRARELFARRLDTLLTQTLWVAERPPIRIQAMQTQWGSCSPKGRLTLNPHLVKAPQDCIDYVILHELCHLAEHNHSDRFYRLMKQVMPEWEKVKTRLDGMAMVLLNGS